MEASPAFFAALPRLPLPPGGVIATTSFTNPRAACSVSSRRDCFTCGASFLIARWISRRSNFTLAFMRLPVCEQPCELVLRRGRHRHGPYVMRAQSAVLVLEQARERQLPEDEVLRPAGFSRQCEDETRRPHWLDQFGGAVGTSLLRLPGRSSTSICAASMETRLFSSWAIVSNIAVTGSSSSKGSRYSSSNAARFSRATFTAFFTSSTGCDWMNRNVVSWRCLSSANIASSCSLLAPVIMVSPSARQSVSVPAEKGRSVMPPALGAGSTKVSRLV